MSSNVAWNHLASSQTHGTSRIHLRQGSSCSISRRSLFTNFTDATSDRGRLSNQKNLPSSGMAQIWGWRTPRASPKSVRQTSGKTEDFISRGRAWRLCSWAFGETSRPWTPGLWETREKPKISLDIASHKLYYVNYKIELNLRLPPANEGLLPGFPLPSSIPTSSLESCRFSARVRS
jgi:hypothetical protein